MAQSDEILERISAVKASADAIPVQAAIARSSVSSGESGGYTEGLIQEAISVTQSAITNYQNTALVGATGEAIKERFPRYGCPEYGPVRLLPDTTDPIDLNRWKELTKPGIYEIGFADDGINIKVSPADNDSPYLEYWLVVRERPERNDQTIEVNIKNSGGGSSWGESITLTPAMMVLDDYSYSYIGGGDRVVLIISQIYGNELETFADINYDTALSGDSLGNQDQLQEVELGDLPTFGSRTRHLKIGDGAPNDVILSCGTISGGSNSGSFVNNSPSFFHNQNNIFTFVSNVPATANKESGVIISTDYQNEMVIGNQSSEIETATLTLQFSPNRAISFLHDDRAYVVVGEDSKATTGEEANLQLLTYDNGGSLLSVNTHMAHNVIELLHFAHNNEKYVLRVENVSPVETKGFARLMILDRALGDIRVVSSSQLNTNPIGASIIRAKGEIYLGVWGVESTDTRLYRMGPAGIFNEVESLPDYFRGLREFEVLGYDNDGLPIITAIRKSDSHIVVFKFDDITKTQTTLASSIRQDYSPGSFGIPVGFSAKELIRLDGNDGSVIVVATQRTYGERGDYGKPSVVLSSSNSVTLGESSTLSDYTSVETFQIEGLTYVSGIIPSPGPDLKGQVKVAIHHSANIFNEVLNLSVTDPVSATFETINTRHYLFVSQGDNKVRTFELVLGQFGFGWASYALPDVSPLPV